MPSTPESLLRTELQATGENATTWGVKTNNNIELLAEAIAGVANVNVGGSGNYTLVASNYVSDEARPATLVLTGLLSGNRDVIVPSSPKHYAINNQTTGAFNLTIRQAAGTGVVIPQGVSQIVCTSVTCVDASGASIFGKSLIIATSAAPARTILGATSVGSSLFIAADTSAARDALGATSVGSSLIIAADTSAARSAIGATSIGSGLIVAADVTAARSAISAAASGNISASGLTMTTGRLLGRVTAATGAVEEIPLGNTASALSLGINRGTEQATTSGTAIDFTGIPAGVRRVTAILNGVSTNGSSVLECRLGTSGGIQATGYAGAVCGSLNGTTTANLNASTGLPLQVISDATFVRHAQITMLNISGNIWSLTVNGGQSDSTRAFFGGATVTLSGALDRLRFVAQNGTDTFDAGVINIMWEF